MLRSLTTFVLLAIVAVPAQAPPDAAVDQALATWKQTRKRSLDGKPDPAAATAVGDLAVEQLTGAQLEKLCAAMLPQTADAALKARCALRLQQLAEPATADGAVAAARLCELVDRSRDGGKDEQAAALRQRVDAIAKAAKHPGLAAAVAAGRGTSLFLQAYFVRDSKLLAEAGVVAALLPLVSDAWPPAKVRELLAFYEVAAEPGSGLDAAAREKLRVLALGVNDKALADENLPARERSYLERQRDQLRGASARGQLMGKDAPQLDVLWSNVEPAPKSLADFRGRIVVLDFWATWCVPCVAAFPHLRELVKKYEGLPVVFVGVTSLQGYVAYPKASEPRQRRVETKDPKDELARLGPWCKDMEMTWTVVVSKQDCFNPEFGVRSIPQLAVIDAEGKVRANGLSPEGSKLEQQIDELLRSMGKQPPAR